MRAPPKLFTVKLINESDQYHHIIGCTRSTWLFNWGGRTEGINLKKNQETLQWLKLENTLKRSMGNTDNLQKTTQINSQKCYLIFLGIINGFVLNSIKDTNQAAGTLTNAHLSLLDSLKMGRKIYRSTRVRNPKGF